MALRWQSPHRILRQLVRTSTSMAVLSGSSLVKQTLSTIALARFKAFFKNPVRLMADPPVRSVLLQTPIVRETSREPLSFQTKVGERRDAKGRSERSRRRRGSGGDRRKRLLLKRFASPAISTVSTALLLL